MSTRRSRVGPFERPTRLSALGLFAACSDVPNQLVQRAAWGHPWHECPDYHGPVIDFSSGSVFKLNPCKTEDIAPAVAPLVIPGEQIVSCLRPCGTSSCSPTSV